MLTYNFDDSKRPLYEQLYMLIKKDIEGGILIPDEHLPSKRSFAKNLGVSTITVENAYDQLMSEGYMYSIAKKGYYVADIKDKNKIVKAVRINSDIKLPEPVKNYIYDLSGNQINPDNFPFSIWARLMRETISRDKNALMTKSFCAGIKPLREAIAAHLYSFRGMAVDPSQILMGAGTEYLYGILLLLLGKDKLYCVENPGYKKIFQIYEKNGARCTYADMDESGITVDGLNEVKAEVAHISPTHHFPTGITMPISRRYEMLAWANEKKGRYIIEDDYDSEFRLNGKPIPSLQSIDAGGKVIYVNTFSKSLSPTIRVSYMVLPVELANKYYKELSFYTCTVSNFEQYTLAKFIGQGYFEKHINRMRLHYSRQRNMVMESLKKSGLSEKCRVLENNSGLHFLLQFETKKNDGELKKLFEKKSIHMQPISDYYYKRTDTQHRFILNYSNVDKEALDEAFDIIKNIL